jgi:arsenate reductase (glutaredoxin)
MNATLARRLAAEALGTALLVATVVGSGIMAETLTKDAGLALLGNTLPTGAILVVLITIFGPISGAHFNPAVSLVFALKHDLRPQETGLYMLAQIIGGIAGTFAAHLMFGLPMLETSVKVRTGGAQWFAEWLATFGLVVTILAGLRFARASVPWLVGLYITAAYWFTASTSFANPAVAIARSLTNTFAGIRPSDAPAFIVAQIVGAICGLGLAGWLLGHSGDTDEGDEPGGAAVTVTIYHNPGCGTSRNVLSMIRQSGEEPVVIEYLKNPLTRERLEELIAAMGIPVRALLREKGTPYAELGLGDPKWTDDQLLDFMMAHPILINRPIVITPKGVRLCRPSEEVLDILPNPNIGRFVKEDGEVVKPDRAHRWAD